MPPIEKQKLLVDLQLHRLIAENIDSTDLDFVENLATLLNAVGMQSIDCRSDAHRSNAPPEIILSAENLVECIIPLVLKIMSNEDDGISENVFPFVGLFLYKLRHVQPLTETIYTYFSNILQIIAYKIRYDKNYNFECEEDYEADFIEYRKELQKLFRAIVRLAPELTFEYLTVNLTRILTSDCTLLPVVEIESFLRLFFVAGEGFSQPTPKELEFAQNGIVLLLNSNVTAHASHVVLLSVFEVLSRFAGLIPKRPEYLQMVLLAFLDERGIRHPKAQVRGRACYLFLRLVKDLIQDIRPYFTQLLASLHPLLTIKLSEQDQALLDSDQQNIYEVAGTICCMLQSEKQTHAQILNEFLTPIIQSMNEILSKELYKQDPPENPQFLSYLIRAMSAIAMFSKGFTTCSEEALEIFKTTLNVEIRALQLLPLNDEIRAKVTFFLHRMIECMRSEIFPYLPTIFEQILHPTSNVQSLTAVIRLMNQLMARFKQEVFELLNQVLMTMVQRVFAYHQHVEDVADQRELQRTYFLFLQAITVNKLGAAFFSDINVAHFPQLLTTLIDGATCKSTDNLKNSKVCFVILQALVKQHPEQISPYISAILDAGFVFGLSPLFDAKNGECVQTVSIIIDIHKILYAANAAALTPLLLQKSAFFGVPDTVTQSYIALLQNAAKARQVTQFFANLLKSLPKPA